MPDKDTNATNRVSSFEKNVYYYKQSDTGNNLVLDAGVYLITVDAGVYNKCGKYYSKDNKEPSDVSDYGCNTNWNNS
jgi:hypothetical protein